MLFLTLAGLCFGSSATWIAGLSLVVSVFGLLVDSGCGLGDQVFRWAQASSVSPQGTALLVFCRNFGLTHAHDTVRSAHRRLDFSVNASHGCCAPLNEVNRSPRGGFTCIGPRLWMVFLLGLLRVGEAAHPGPDPDTWTLGIANPSGLNGKLDQVAHLTGDVWLMSETQLSQKGVSSFTKGLKMLKSPWRYVIPGAPCTSRQRTDTGTHAGVMVVSRHPARALPHGFSTEVFESARVQVAGVALAGTWVTVGVMYGFPCNAHHKQARFQTESILADLVERVGLQTVGPRAIGGDFNYGPEELEQVERLKELGFREVQDLRALRHGFSVEPTGRGTRRLDQLWISPELQHAYCMTQVDFDHWADHAAVSASFSLAALSSAVHVWRVPQPFPWPAEWSCKVCVDFQGDLTTSYAQFWNQVETQAKGWNQHHGLSVTRKQCGRASVLETTPTRHFLAPVKKGREGDIQPEYLGVSLQHARFFRQLRRLQSLCRILAKGELSWSGRFNRDDTWRAIRTAVGFPGGFGLWWGVQGLQPVLEGPLPLLCPALDFAQGLFTGFQTFVRQYEQKLISHRYQFSKTRREKCLAHVFRDCKDDPLPQADTLLDRLEIGVEEVRPEDQSLVLTKPVRLLEEVPVVVGGVVVEVGCPF